MDLRWYYAGVYGDISVNCCGIATALWLVSVGITLVFTVELRWNWAGITLVVSGELRWYCVGFCGCIAVENY